MWALHLRLLFLALLGVGLSPAGADAAAGRMRLSYDIYFGGLILGDVTVTASWSETDYQVRADGHSRGLVDLLAGFVSEAVSEGRFGADGARPLRHRARNRFLGEDRLVALDYGPGGDIAAEVAPTAEQDEREAVPVADRRDTVDPLSAGLLAWRTVLQGGTCHADLRVFDGRRRYDLRFVEKGTARWQEGEADRPALLCELDIERLAGFSENPWLPETRRIHTATVWLVRLADGQPPVPVRIESPQGMGSAVVRLTAVDGVPPGRAKLASAH